MTQQRQALPRRFTETDPRVHQHAIARHARIDHFS